MAKIEPVIFPLNAGTTTELNVLVLNFLTDATTCTTYYELKTDQGTVLITGQYILTEAEFAAWGLDNKYVTDCVANAIGVTIITY
jgi:hypothetical protein